MPANGVIVIQSGRLTIGAHTMNALKWLRESGQQPIRPVYAVFGDDSYLIRESIRAVVRAVFPGEEGDATISRFTGAQASLAQVLDEVCTLAVLQPAAAGHRRGGRPVYHQAQEGPGSLRRASSAGRESCCSSRSNGWRPRSWRSSSTRLAWRSTVRALARVSSPAG